MDRFFGMNVDSSMGIQSWEQKTLNNNLSVMRNMIKEKDGSIFYNLNSDILKKEAIKNHFETSKPIFFNKE